MPENMKGRTWLWKGTRNDVRRPILACAIAPLFALVPSVPIFILALNRGALANSYYHGLDVAFYAGMVLLISYGMTVLVGLPWFLFLSKEGVAGFLPVVSASLLPLCFVWIAAHAKGQDVPLVTYLFFLVTGLTASTAFWKIVRTPSKSLFVLPRPN